MKDMVKRKILIGAIALLTLSSTSALSHQHVWEEILAIAKKLDEKKAGRCVENEEIPQERCKVQQDAMIETGCVKPEHVDYIRKYGIYPLCDVFHKPLSACFCGCFARGTRIFARARQAGVTDWLPIEILIAKPDDYEVATLSKESVLSNLSLDWKGIELVTSGPEAHPLVVISADDGSRISLTREHAVLRADGKMVEAIDLREGDELVNINGARTKVDKIERMVAEGYVYNIITTGTTSIEHVIVAENLFMGDLRWQSFLPMGENEFAVHP